jgi:hypothetical protein
MVAEFRSKLQALSKNAPQLTTDINTFLEKLSNYQAQFDLFERACKNKLVTGEIPTASHLTDAHRNVSEEVSTFLCKHRQHTLAKR